VVEPSAATLNPVICPDCVPGDPLARDATNTCAIVEGGVGEGVGVGVEIGVGVGNGVGFGNGDGLGIGVGVGDGLGVGLGTTPNPPFPFVTSHPPSQRVTKRQTAMTRTIFNSRETMMTLFNCDSISGP
jgi:hypothetical protein